MAYGQMTDVLQREFRRISDWLSHDVEYGTRYYHLEYCMLHGITKLPSARNVGSPRRGIERMNRSCHHAADRLGLDHGVLWDDLVLLRLSIQNSNWGAGAGDTAILLKHGMHIWEAMRWSFK
jgi:hypothetical protein